jgi:hypothetical protein
MEFFYPISYNILIYRQGIHKTGRITSMLNTSCQKHSTLWSFQSSGYSLQFQYEQHITPK